MDRLFCFFAITERRVHDANSLQVRSQAKCPVRNLNIAVNHTSDLKIGTPVATLPGAWRYRSALGLVGLVSVYCDRVR